MKQESVKVWGETKALLDAYKEAEGRSISFTIHKAVMLYMEKENFKLKEN